MTFPKLWKWFHLTVNCLTVSVHLDFRGLAGVHRACLGTASVTPLLWCWLSDSKLTDKLLLWKEPENFSCFCITHVHTPLQYLTSVYERNCSLQLRSHSLRREEKLCLLSKSGPDQLWLLDKAFKAMVCNKPTHNKMMQKIGCLWRERVKIFITVCRAETRRNKQHTGRHSMALRRQRWSEKGTARSQPWQFTVSQMLFQKT